jgi:hypothetical protein
LREAGRQLVELTELSILPTDALLGEFIPAELSIARREATGKPCIGGKVLGEHRLLLLGVALRGGVDYGVLCDHDRALIAIAR